MNEEELTAPQAAALVGCTRAAINNAIRGGRLAARKEETPRGPIYCLKREDVQAWAALANEKRKGRPMGGRSQKDGQS